MDNYEVMYKKVCRVCLLQSDSETMISLTDNDSSAVDNCFAKSLTIITSVTFDEDDDLPDKMCQKCACLLKQAIRFKLLCESSDRKLKLLKKNLDNNDVSGRSFKEAVCEYVMFNNYFPSELTPKPGHETQGNKPKTEPDKINVELKKDMDNDNFSVESDIMDTIDNNYNKSADETLEKIQCLLNPDSILPFHNIKQIFKKKNVERNTYIQKSTKNFTCQICGRVLANRLTYDHHMQRHNSCRFMCEYCGKGFPVQVELHMHQSARHGAGPYLQCAHCPYRAPRKLTMIEHLRKHTGERPFACDQCGLTFHRQALWRNHLACHTDKKYQCESCQKKFSRRSHLLVHKNNAHERIYMYGCRVCNAAYAKSGTVRRHMLLKHGIPREDQGKISKVYSNQFASTKT